MNILDTIAAISTPYGKGGVALLRISGSDAIRVAAKMFVPKSSKPLEEIPSNKAIYGDIFSEAGGQKIQIDDGIAVIFRAPSSFTGEDTVEITCHGGVLITQKVLESILLSGARQATAGEFTKRAYINGKMTLTSAEALGDLLEAGNNEQIKLSRSGMRGTLSREIGGIYNSLCDILSAIYAKIDYPDEDLAEISRDEMIENAKSNLERLTRLSRTYSTGHAVNEGIKTAIVGRTNAGKSTLYNKILGRDAAIVTSIEGTTRDILTEKTRLGKVTLSLSDTAGLRDTGDVVEKIGIDRAKREAEDAELILAVFDGSREADADDAQLVSYLTELNGIKIAIINKSDLGTHESVLALTSNFDYTVRFCANSGEGFDTLEKTVEQIYIDNDLDMGSSAIISNARQNTAILKAIHGLSEALGSILSDLPLEICCVQMEDAMSYLGELDGKTVSEDIISRIFANFCVGK